VDGRIGPDGDETRGEPTSNGFGPGRDGRPSDDDILDELAQLVDQDPDAFSGLDEDDVASLRLDLGDDDPDGGATRTRNGGDQPDPEPLALYPAWEYTTILLDPLHTADEEIGRAGGGPSDAIARARRLLQPVQESLTDAGFYAYGTVDDQNRWTIAVDDEGGRVDVWVGHGGLVIALWTSSPGLYADVENPWRRRRIERAVRGSLARVGRGMLAPHQLVTWDEVEQGVAVGVRYLIPVARAAEAGPIVRARLPELMDLLQAVERRLGD